MQIQKDVAAIFEKEFTKILRFTGDGLQQRFCLTAECGIFPQIDQQIKFSVEFWRVNAITLVPAIPAASVGLTVIPLRSGF